MISRREFLRISGMASAAALVNWQCPVLAQSSIESENGYDAIIIGAGLGGLSCAGFLARNGFKPLVIDQRNKPGGYATSFQRNVTGHGVFTCEASLHGITGNPISWALLDDTSLGLGVSDKLNLLRHEYGWSSLYPGPFPLDIPVSDLNGITNALLYMFPHEREGITGYMACWQGLLEEIEDFYNPTTVGMPADPADFPQFYPTWASMLDKMKTKKM
ncbi:MAG: FAD-binding protein [Candidatus Electrothrix sp. MAN1_4]|nr:FAD-binding protein [Candidatus Electrothrix sp. MAN1_4]